MAAVSEKKNMSVKLSIDATKSLQKMAQERNRSVHFLMVQAIEKYITDAEREQAAKQAFYEQAANSLQDMRQTGLHVTHDEMMQWAESLESDNPLALPTCHK